MNFETAELARYANRVIWPARAIAEDYFEASKQMKRVCAAAGL